MSFFYRLLYHVVVLLPQPLGWFGLFPVRSPLLGESLLFSFPACTKMFQYPALASIIDGCHLFKVTGCPIWRVTDHGLFALPRD